MSDSPTPAGIRSVLNVPNQLTLVRLALSLVLFVFLSLGWYATSFVLFAVAAGTDWIDGYWARKYGQVTQLGRILDPFADKLIICGTFVFLAAVPRLADGALASGIAAWMTVVILGRELLVTALRSFVEHRGGDFSASWIGKWKMVVQCVAAGWSMVLLTYFDAASAAWRSTPPVWMTQGLTLVVWLALVLTLYSGLSYVRAAIRMLREAA